MAISRSFGGTSLTFLPSIWMLPLLISSSPAIMRNIVDLPQPEGPTKTMNSSLSTVRLTSSTAMTPLPFSPG